MQKMPYGFIYITTNLINNKKYIGQCVYHKRKNWERYLGSGPYLMKAVKKYGRTNFSREILCNTQNQENLNWLEQYFIREHQAVERSDYYNIAFGGQITKGFLGKTHTDEHKQYIKKFMLEHHPMKGKKMPVDSVRRGADKKRGKSIHTDEFKDKIRQLGLSNKGKTMSDEVKHKISKSHKGLSCKNWIVQLPSKEHRIVTNLPQFCADSGINIKHLYGSLYRGTQTTNGYLLIRPPIQ